MKVFHGSRVRLPLPDGHRFPARKYELLRHAAEQGAQGWTLLAADPASEGELELAHAPSYVEAVRCGTLDPAHQREIGLPWSPQLVQRACLSVGATIQAARAALEDGVAATLGGGTHHAQAGRGGGYCVFNDVAVATRVLQAEWRRQGLGILRVAVVDLDVHQGNGTAAIFRDDPSVFTLSVHGARNFPFRKEASDLDIELPDGCGDAEYLEALDEALRSMWAALGSDAPGLVFYLAGADPHEGDRLGRLKLSFDGLAQRDRRVFDELRARRTPVAVAMAGGYGSDIRNTVAVHMETLRQGAASWRRWRMDARV